jgi:hypothetical protein
VGWIPDSIGVEYISSNIVKFGLDITMRKINKEQIPIDGRLREIGGLPKFTKIR